jgi:quercetin dioxygenase-like cupin family protein
MPTLPTLTTLHRAEFPGDYATVMVLIENVDGAPRHTHPGLETTYILEGEFNLMVDGRPDQPLKPGDWFEVPAEVRTVWRTSAANQGVRSRITSSKGTNR